MEIHQLTNLKECLEHIEKFQATCEKRFNPEACKNMRNWSIDFCHRRFPKTSTISSESTPGDKTLNLTYKSPSDPR